MLSGNQTISTYTPRNLCIWMVLAFQGGWLNIGGFMACHSFVSHVTGLYTTFGYELHQENIKYAIATILVPAFFLAGAVLSGVLIDVRLKLQKRPGYHLLFGVLFGLLLFVAVAGFNRFFGVFGDPVEHSHNFTLLILLCLVCGIQNGMVTLVSRSVVRTTHMTGITTDLGIGLARVLNSARLGAAVSEESKANFMRIGVIVSFVLGSALGAGTFERFGFRGFVVPCALSGTLFFLSLYLGRPAPPRTA